MANIISSKSYQGVIQLKIGNRILKEASGVTSASIFIYKSAGVNFFTQNQTCVSITLSVFPNAYASLACLQGSRLMPAALNIKTYRISYSTYSHQDFDTEAIFSA